jgi:hypothetical protein
MFSRDFRGIFEGFSRCNLIKNQLKRAMKLTKNAINNTLCIGSISECY